MEKNGQRTFEVDPEFVAKVRERAKEYDKVITVCNVGWRAASAAALLQKVGMENLYVFHHGLQGRVNGRGITKGWRAHGLPYIKTEAKEKDSQ